jgi:hypothetical protein
MYHLAEYDPKAVDIWACHHPVASSVEQHGARNDLAVRRACGRGQTHMATWAEAVAACSAPPCIPPPKG